MDDSDNILIKKDKKLKNFIVICAIVYFLFVLEESTEENRRRIYKTLILISTIFLILSNFEFCKNKFLELVYYPLIKKQTIIKEEDNTKKILEMTMKKHFIQKSSDIIPRNKKPSDTEYNYVDSYMKQNKLLNYQDQKFNDMKDFPQISGKFTDMKNQIFTYDGKTFNTNFSYSPHSTRNIQQNRFSFNLNDVYNQKSPLKQDIDFDKSVTYRYYQELKDSKKFKNKLEQFDIMAYFNDYDKFEKSKQTVLEDKNLNLNRFTDNIKKYFSEESIPYILTYHFENFDNINKIFVETLKIRLVSNMQEDINNKIFEEEMHKAFHDSYLNFPADHFYSSFSNKQALYEQNEKNLGASSGRAGIYSNPDYNRVFGQNNMFGIGNPNYKDRFDGFHDYNKGNYEKKNTKFNIFFGDRIKIGILIDIIESKLMILMKNKLQQGSQINANKSGYERPFINDYEKKGNFRYSNDNLFQNENDFENELLKMKFQNPLIKKNKYNLVLDYSEAILKNNSYLENNLKYLRFLLISRLELNEYFCSFNKIQSMKHYYINLEYAVQRLGELQKDRLNSFRNDCGGKFFEDNWISAFPTDSQLLFSIFLKFLEQLWNEKNQAGRSFLISFPLSPVLEDNSNHLFFYQNNDLSVEPHLNIIFKTEMLFLPSGRDNLFEAIVYFLLLVKFKMEKLEKKLSIEDFTNTVIKN